MNPLSQNAVSLYNSVDFQASQQLNAGCKVYESLANNLGMTFAQLFLAVEELVKEGKAEWLNVSTIKKIG